MKLSFICEMKSIECSCCFSDSYNGWNDSVGKVLNDKVDDSISSAQSKINEILNDVKKDDCNFENDMDWIKARLENLKK